MEKFLFGLMLAACLLALPQPATSKDSAPPSLESVFSGTIQAALRQFKPEGNLRLLEKAVYFSEIRAAWLYWARCRRTDGDPANGREAPSDQTELIRLLGRYTAALELRESDPVFRDLDVALASLEKRCLGARNDADAEFSLALPRMEDLDVRAIQKKLTSAGIIIRFILLPERIVSIVISDRSVETFESPVDTASTVKLIRNLAEPLDDFGRGRVDYLRIHFALGLAQRLYDILLRNILESHPDKTDVYIIPDRELFHLPFEALVVGFNKNELKPEVLFSEYDSADYLIQFRSVSYFLSLADFQKRFAPPSAYKLKLAAFGNPMIPEAQPKTGASASERESPRIGEIPSTEAEILSLQKFFPPDAVQFFLNSRCNERNFEEAAPGSRLIHVATHFYCDADKPLDSAFLFSSNVREPPFYSSRRISRLRLNAELVVLSACETSERRLLEMKGFTGVTAAFRRSGVRSLVVSLLPVDEYNSQVIPLFYEDFLKCGNASHALRQAKLALIKKVIPLRDHVRLSFAHPFLWANFILYHFFRPSP